MAVPYTFGTATSSIPLSQLDSNFATVITLGNTAIQLGNTVTTLNNMTLANVTISSGNVTITNVTITTANVTTANIGTAFVSGNVSFTSTGNRITGDFSNATLASRVMFQTSTTNGATNISAIPNGTGAGGQLHLFGSSDSANSAFLQVAGGANSGTEHRIAGTITGTGTYLPMTFYAGGSEAMRIAVAAGGIRAVGIGYTTLTGVGDNGLAVLGNVGIGTSSPGVKADINGVMRSSTWSLSGTGVTGGTAAFAAGTVSTDSNWGMYFRAPTSSSAIANYSFRNSADTALMTIDSSGNVGIGTNSPGAKLAVISGTSPNVATLQIGYSGSNNYYDANLHSFRNGAQTEVARIDSSGNVLVVNPAGLGYGTGSGGTVTQATDKSTAVTLNKPTGQITMNNAALAGGASATFGLNNSLLGAYDTIIATPSTSTNYSVEIAYCGSGVAYLRVTNKSAGSLSDAVLINFSIIKGAVA